MILKLYKGGLKSWEAEIKNLQLSTKTKLLCWAKSLKDLILWLRGKTMKSELWEARFKTHNRTWDYQLPRPPNLLNNWLNTGHNFKWTTPSHKLTDRKFKSFSTKTTSLVNKSGTPNKIWDCLHHKSANWTTNSKSHATKTKPFKKDFRKLELTLQEDLLTLKIKWDC